VAYSRSQILCYQLAPGALYMQQRSLAVTPAATNQPLPSKYWAMQQSVEVSQAGSLHARHVFSLSIVMSHLASLYL
jgi:hypothetical protein